MLAAAALALALAGQAPEHGARGPLRCMSPAVKILDILRVAGGLLPKGCWTGDLPVQRPYPIPRVPRPSKSDGGGG